MTRSRRNRPRGGIQTDPERFAHDVVLVLHHLILSTALPQRGSDLGSGRQPLRRNPVRGRSEDGFGTIFRLTPKGQMTIIYNFTGGADGAYQRVDLPLPATATSTERT